MYEPSLLKYSKYNSRHYVIPNILVTHNRNDIRIQYILHHYRKYISILLEDSSTVQL